MRLDLAHGVRRGSLARSAENEDCEGGNPATQCLAVSTRFSAITTPEQVIGSPVDAIRTRTIDCACAAPIARYALSELPP
jgi:hypothetical protein